MFLLPPLLVIHKFFLSKMATTNESADTGESNKIFLIILLVLSVFIVILLLITNFIIPPCGGVTGGCADDNPCTADSTDASGKCTHVSIDGPNLACSGPAGLCKARTCGEGSCIEELILNCCGNAICEINETSSFCPMDCGGGGLVTHTDEHGDEYTDYHPEDGACEPNSGNSDGAICDCRENDCDDGVDNDNDGQIDCYDPDCDCLPENCPDCPDCGDCEQSKYPSCGGTCPNNELCMPVTDTAGVQSCSCEPTQQQMCERSQYPSCGGYCPNNELCMPASDAAGTMASCYCQPTDQSPCEQTRYPYCGGTCPTNEVCTPVQGTTSEGACQCEPTTQNCEDQQYPACTGVCPSQTQRCTAVKNQCSCEEQTIACEDSYQYQCTGECPSGKTCMRDAYGGCNCRDLQCEDSVAPACNGDCPDNYDCEYVGGTTAAGACQCVQQSTDCEDADYPSCIGDCPDNERCIAMQTSCECTSGGWVPLDCEDSKDYPYCAGTCPENQRCTAMQTSCACVTDYTCSSMSSKLCGQGTCPPGMYCGVGTSADYCMCYSAPV